MEAFDATAGLTRADLTFTGDLKRPCGPTFFRRWFVLRSLALGKCARWPQRMAH